MSDGARPTTSRSRARRAGRRCPLPAPPGSSPPPARTRARCRTSATTWPWGAWARPRPPRRALAPPVFAAFTVLPIQGPMVAEVALFTTNAGRSWSFVPTPPGAKRTGFGGFRYQGDDVDALFSPSAPAPDGQAGPPLVEQTADGGRSWSRASLSCPAAGPCVTFGAHVPGNCAQGLDSQGVIASSDNGRHWTEPSWPAGLVTCWPTTLEATSPAQALLVTSNAVLGSESPFDVLVTNDGGRSWQAISLPPLPPAPGDQGGQAAPGPRGQATSPSCPAAACCTSTRRPGSFWPPGPAPGAPSGRWAREWPSRRLGRRGRPDSGALELRRGRRRLVVAVDRLHRRRARRGQRP